MQWQHPQWSWLTIIWNILLGVFRCHLSGFALCIVLHQYVLGPPKQVRGKHNASKSLLMITDSTDKRAEKIYQASQREQQYTIIASKLSNKNTSIEIVCICSTTCLMLAGMKVVRGSPRTHGLYETSRRTHSQDLRMMSCSWAWCFRCTKMFTAFPWWKKYTAIYAMWLPTLRTLWYSVPSYSENHKQDWG